MSDDPQVEKNLAFTEVPQHTNWPPAAIAWYSTMCCLVLVNLALFFLVHTVLLARDRDTILRPYESRMRAAGLTVLVIFAYRTFFLVTTLDRYVWHDTIFSSILLIKLLTYVAEQAFVGMIIYATRENSFQINRGEGGWWLYTRLSTLFVGAAVTVGQLFSFLGLVKKSYLYLVARACSWLLGFAVLAPAVGYILFHSFRASRERGERWCGFRPSCWTSEGFSCRGTGQLFALVMVMFLAVYLPWLCFQELPTHFNAYSEEYAHDLPDLEFFTGLWDALTFRVQTKDWEVWRTVVWWNTLCTTVGSWVAIFLSTGPLLPEHEGGGWNPLGGIFGK